MKNFALRFINGAVGEPHSEKELAEMEKRIDIVRKNQKYIGLINYPETRKSLKESGEFLIWLSQNKKSSLANILSGLQTTHSILQIHIDKLRLEYKKEGSKIKRIIAKQESK